MNTARARAREQVGMTLIEVLVAILIFSFGLLGFVGLQARAIGYSSSAEDSNRAALLANEIAASAQLSGSVVLPPTTISDWQARVADPTVAGLPSGVGSYVQTSANTASITIRWQPPSAAGTPTATNQYITQVVLP